MSDLRERRFAAIDAALEHFGARFDEMVLPEEVARADSEWAGDVRADAWNETDHPRDPDGKFASGGGSSAFKAYAASAKIDKKTGKPKLQASGFIKHMLMQGTMSVDEIFKELQSEFVYPGNQKPHVKYYWKEMKAKGIDVPDIGSKKQLEAATEEVLEATGVKATEKPKEEEPAVPKVGFPHAKSVAATNGGAVGPTIKKFEKNGTDPVGMALLKNTLNAEAETPSIVLTKLYDMGVAGEEDELPLAEMEPMTGTDPGSVAANKLLAHLQEKAGVKAAAKVTPKAEKPPIADADKWTKIGGQLGSNPGGRYKDESGQEYYVKQSKSDSHAKNEVLASKLYAAAGAPVVDSNLVKTKGKLGTAAKWKTKQGDINPNSQGDVDAATKNFAVHAWLANWDAAGLSFDNQAMIDGKMTTMDVGGSLLYRAQGEKKTNWGESVGEWNTLRDAKINKQNAEIFGSMTDAELKASAQAVVNVSDAQIIDLVNEYGPGDANDKGEMIDTLIKRKADLAARAGIPNTPNAEFESKHDRNPDGTFKKGAGGDEPAKEEKAEEGGPTYFEPQHEDTVDTLQFFVKYAPEAQKKLAIELAELKTEYPGTINSAVYDLKDAVNQDNGPEKVKAILDIVPITSTSAAMNNDPGVKKFNELLASVQESWSKDVQAPKAFAAVPASEMPWYKKTVDEVPHLAKVSGKTDASYDKMEKAWAALPDYDSDIAQAISEKVDQVKLALNEEDTGDAENLIDSIEPLPFGLLGQPDHFAAEQFNTFLNNLQADYAEKPKPAAKPINPHTDLFSQKTKNKLDAFYGKMLTHPNTKELKEADVYLEDLIKMAGQADQKKAYQEVGKLTTNHLPDTFKADASNLTYEIYKDLLKKVDPEQHAGSYGHEVDEPPQYSEIPPPPKPKADKGAKVSAPTKEFHDQLKSYWPGTLPANLEAVKAKDEEIEAALSQDDIEAQKAALEPIEPIGGNSMAKQAMDSYLDKVKKDYGIGVEPEAKGKTTKAKAEAPSPTQVANTKAIGELIPQRKNEESWNIDAQGNEVRAVLRINTKEIHGDGYAKVTAAYGGDPANTMTKPVDAAMQSFAQGNWNTLSGTQHSAIQSYKGSGYIDLNKAMIDGELDKFPSLKKKANAISAAIKTSRVPAATHVFRGVRCDLKTFTGFAKPEDAIGKCFEHKNFASVSRRRETSETFGTQVMMRMSLPAGIPGVVLPGALGSDQTGGEREIVLDQKSIFRIVGFEDTSKHYGKKDAVMLHVEYVGRREDE